MATTVDQLITAHADFDRAIIALRTGDGSRDQVVEANAELTRLHDQASPEVQAEVTKRRAEEN